MLGLQGYAPEIGRFGRGFRNARTRVGLRPAGTPGKIEFKLPNIQNGENEQKHGAKYTEAEVQQLLMGLKREHKDNLELLQKDHDEALFKQRGEQATSVEYYVEKIQNLEEELQTLRPKSKKNSIIGTFRVVFLLDM